MTRRRDAACSLPAIPLALALACVMLFAVFSGYGCNSHSHTSDAHLRKIDEILYAQLPQGTPRARVEYFLNSRGYKIEGAPRKDVVVAVIHHVDTDTLQPATARATFHFDPNDKLISYELQAAPDAPLPR
jgi:hypothetical protein